MTSYASGTKSVRAPFGRSKIRSAEKYGDAGTGNIIINTHSVRPDFGANIRVRLSSSGSDENRASLQNGTAKSCDDRMLRREKAVQSGSLTPRSRGRPRGENEPDPFLAVDSVPEGKATEVISPERPKKRKMVAVEMLPAEVPRSARKGMGSPINKSSNSLNRSRLGSPDRCFRSPSPTRPIYVSPNKERKANHHIRAPFKHAINKPPMEAVHPNPAEAMIERTALATYQLSMVIGNENTPQTRKPPGHLWKGRLQPLYPVVVEGPSIYQCQGIQPEPRRPYVVGVPSQTVQRRQQIMATYPDLPQYVERPQTVESVHNTSRASSMAENRDQELVLQMDEETLIDQPQEMYYGDQYDPDQMIVDDDLAMDEDIEIAAVTGTPSHVPYDPYRGEHSRDHRPGSGGSDKENVEYSEIVTATPQKITPIGPVRCLKQDDHRPQTAPEDGRKSVRFADQPSTYNTTDLKNRSMSAGVMHGVRVRQEVSQLPSVQPSPRAPTAFSSTSSASGHYAPKSPPLSINDTTQMPTGPSVTRIDPAQPQMQFTPAPPPPRIPGSDIKVRTPRLGAPESPIPPIGTKLPSPPTSPLAEQEHLEPTAPPAEEDEPEVLELQKWAEDTVTNEKQDAEDEEQTANDETSTALEENETDGMEKNDVVMEMEKTVEEAAHYVLADDEQDDSVYVQSETVEYVTAELQQMPKVMMKLQEMKPIESLKCSMHEDVAEIDDELEAYYEEKELVQLLPLKEIIQLEPALLDENVMLEKHEHVGEEIEEQAPVEKAAEHVIEEGTKEEVNVTDADDATDSVQGGVGAGDFESSQVTDVDISSERIEAPEDEPGTVGEELTEIEEAIIEPEKAVPLIGERTVEEVIAQQEARHGAPVEIDEPATVILTTDGVAEAQDDEALSSDEKIEAVPEIDGEEQVRDHSPDPVLEAADVVAVEEEQQELSSDRQIVETPVVPEEAVMLGIDDSRKDDEPASVDESYSISEAIPDEQQEKADVSVMEDGALQEDDNIAPQNATEKVEETKEDVLEEQIEVKEADFDTTVEEAEKMPESENQHESEQQVDAEVPAEKSEEEASAPEEKDQVDDEVVGEEFVFAADETQAQSDVDVEEEYKEDDGEVLAAEDEVVTNAEEEQESAEGVSQENEASTAVEEIDAPEELVDSSVNKEEETELVHQQDEEPQLEVSDDKPDEAEIAQLPASESPEPVEGKPTGEGDVEQVAEEEAIAVEQVESKDVAPIEDEASAELNDVPEVENVEQQAEPEELEQEVSVAEEETDETAATDDAGPGDETSITENVAEPSVEDEAGEKQTDGAGETSAAVDGVPEAEDSIAEVAAESVDVTDGPSEEPTEIPVEDVVDAPGVIPDALPEQEECDGAQSIEVQDVVDGGEPIPEQDAGSRRSSQSSTGKEVEQLLAGHDSDSGSIAKTETDVTIEMDIDTASGTESRASTMKRADDDDDDEEVVEEEEDAKAAEDADEKDEDADDEGGDSGDANNDDGNDDAGGNQDDAGNADDAGDADDNNAGDDERQEDNESGDAGEGDAAEDGNEGNDDDVQDQNENDNQGNAGNDDENDEQNEVKESEGEGDCQGSNCGTPGQVDGDNESSQEPCVDGHGCGTPEPTEEAEDMPKTGSVCVDGNGCGTPEPESQPNVSGECVDGHGCGTPEPVKQADSVGATQCVDGHGCGTPEPESKPNERGSDRGCGTPEQVDENQEECTPPPGDVAPVASTGNLVPKKPTGSKIQRPYSGKGRTSAVSGDNSKQYKKYQNCNLAYAGHVEDEEEENGRNSSPERSLSKANVHKRVKKGRPKSAFAGSAGKSANSAELRIGNKVKQNKDADAEKKRILRRPRSAAGPAFSSSKSRKEEEELVELRIGNFTGGEEVRKSRPMSASGRPISASVSASMERPAWGGRPQSGARQLLVLAPKMKEIHSASKKKLKFKVRGEKMESASGVSLNTLACSYCGAKGRRIMDYAGDTGFCVCNLCYKKMNEQADDNGEDRIGNPTAEANATLDRFFESFDATDANEVEVISEIEEEEAEEPTADAADDEEVAGILETCIETEEADEEVNRICSAREDTREQPRENTQVDADVLESGRSAKVCVMCGLEDSICVCGPDTKFVPDSSLLDKISYSKLENVRDGIKKSRIAEELKRLEDLYGVYSDDSESDGDIEEIVAAEVPVASSSSDPDDSEELQEYKEQCESADLPCGNMSRSLTAEKPAKKPPRFKPGSAHRKSSMENGRVVLMEHTVSNDGSQAGDVASEAEKDSMAAAPINQEMEEEDGKLEVVATAKTISKSRSGADEAAPVAPYPPLCFKINARPPQGYLYYFAYGTDMNAERLQIYLGREMTDRFWGLLYGFKLVFNKKGADVEAGGFSNLEFNPHSSVEGCLYLITPAELKVLDQYVGYPEHYEHAMFPTWLLNCTEPDLYGVAQYCVPALTYIAQDKWTQKPTDPALSTEYNIRECLKNADLLTPAYKHNLNEQLEAAQEPTILQ